MKYQEKLKQYGVSQIQFHCVLGSGFGEALQKLKCKNFHKIATIPFGEIDGLMPSTVPDHAGVYDLYRHTPTGHIVQFQRGRVHGYEGHSPQVAVQPVMLPRWYGDCKNFILTNAAGGLFPTMKSGDAMVISDHFNFTGTNPLVGHNPKSPFTQQEAGPRFPDLSELYTPKLRPELLWHITHQGVRVHEGSYIGVMGPNFETPQEVRLFQAWGLGAVGMSTVWEAIALHHSGANVLGVSLISNPGAGLSAEKLDHLVILETCRQSAGSILEGIVSFMETKL